MIVKIIWALFLVVSTAQAADCDTEQDYKRLDYARISSVSYNEIVFNEGRTSAHIPQFSNTLIREFIGYTVAAEICRDDLGQWHLSGFEIDDSRNFYHIQIVDGMVMGLRVVGEEEYNMGLYRPGTQLVLIVRPSGEQVEVAMTRRTYTGSADPKVPNVEGLEVALGDHVRLVTHAVRNQNLVSSDRIFLLKSFVHAEKRSHFPGKVTRAEVFLGM